MDDQARHISAKSLQTGATLVDIETRMYNKLYANLMEDISHSFKNPQSSESDRDGKTFELRFLLNVSPRMEREGENTPTLKELGDAPLPGSKTIKKRGKVNMRFS
ncbi:hypothetical protein HHI36_002198 [Cryptolaemus montrouzieri]|uniref:Uncharacterized protein n=1 Tax=Cryptolaemus montrouzieri TaxID=559131 RepID=A0ABD2P9Q6_9CUCU